MPLVVLGIVVGAITPVQTAVNTRLRKAVGTPFRASLVSFAVGLVTLLAVTLAIGPYPLVPASAWRGPWWMWFAGLFGVVFMTGNVLLLPKLGSLQTVMMPVLGQILMGLLIDEFGWFGSPVHRMTALRAVGAALALAGFLTAIVLADVVAGRGGGNRPRAVRHAGGVPRAGRAVWLWRGLGVMCGMSSAVQTSMLGRLGTELGSPIKASLVSFILGFLALMVIVAVRDRGFGLRRALRGDQPVWMWFGGFLGALVVLTNSVLSPRLGTGLTVLVALLGQVIGGLLIDGFGWFGVPRRRVTVVQVAGIVAALIGIAAIRLS